MGKLINYRRFQLGQDLGIKSNFRVIRGPFTGMNWGKHANWGQFDLANQLLGFYEERITKSLEILSKDFSFSTFIDIGAGDGYFMTGALHSKLYKKGIAFEESEIQRQTILKNLTANGLKDNFLLFGRATEDSILDLGKTDQTNFAASVFLVDIEGSEYELLSKTNLEVMRHSAVLVEIHNYEGKNNQAKSLLIEQVRLTHNLVIIEMGPRNLDDIPEVSLFNDSDRWLICSEGRPEKMQWFILLPKYICEKDFQKKLLEHSQ
jgi:hypothetical protein